jgi:hypothetical protein
MGGDLGFVVSHPLQEASGVLGSFGLNLGSCPTDTPATVVQVASRESECLVVGRVSGCEYPLDTRVNSDDAAFSFGLGKSYFVTKDEIPVFTFLTEFGVFPSPDRWNSAVVDLDGLTPETKTFFVGEGKVSLPDDGHDISSELDWMPFLLSLLGQECSGNTSERRAGKLGRQTEILPDGVVMLGVKFQGMDLFGIVDNGGNPVTSGKVLDT